MYRSFHRCILDAYYLVIECSISIAVLRKQHTLVQNDTSNGDNVFCYLQKVCFRFSNFWSIDELQYVVVANNCASSTSCCVLEIGEEKQLSFK